MVTTADLGQGLGTVLAQLVAETLALSVSSVVVSTESTDGAPDGGGTGGNRQTCYIGNARAGCGGAHEGLRGGFGRRDAGEAASGPGAARRRGRGGGSQRGGSRSRNSTTQGSRDATGDGTRAGRGRSIRTRRAPHTTPTASAASSPRWKWICATGRIAVRRVTVAHDVGTALNPQAGGGATPGWRGDGPGIRADGRVRARSDPRLLRVQAPSRRRRAGDPYSCRSPPVRAGDLTEPRVSANAPCSPLRPPSSTPSPPPPVCARESCRSQRPELRRLLQEAAQANE